VNGKTDVAKRLDKLLADDFKSINAKETRGKAQLIGQVGFFWELIPDLKREPHELLQDGNKVIVRSTFSGQPKGDFMDLPLDGTKSFSTMSIDIHTVENGKIKMVHHIEEWPTALAQLS